jgi:hypothetical protein
MSTATILALTLSANLPAKDQPLARRHAVACLARLAETVVKYAERYRRLTEQACNQELTPRQETARDKAGEGADSLLRPYGYRIGHPWGLCVYAIPLDRDSDRLSESDCILLA